MFVGDYQQPAYQQKAWELTGHSSTFKASWFDAVCGTNEECQVQLTQLDLRLKQCTPFENCDNVYQSMIDLADEYNRKYDLDYVWE